MKEVYKMEEITTQELKHKMENDEHIVLIDVREEFEVKFGKIPGAWHIPLQELPNTTTTLDKNKEYILICRSGGRSAMGCQLLEMQGFTTFNVIDGMVGWRGELEF